MYEEYPISGIKQSYRYTSRSRTIVLPVLMIALVAFMVIFYIKGKPTDVVDDEPVIAAASPTKTIGNVSESTVGEEISEVLSTTLEETESSKNKEAQPDTQTDAPQDQRPENAANTVKPSGQDDAAFTPWMAPLALDTYIRAKTDGTGRTFWENGHWITAVEGRWNNGSREFRIAYDTIPEIETWQWRYKVNQSQAEFALSVTEMVEQGYTLVQTQTFREPDGNHRYQGVWHRQLSRPTVVDTDPVQSIIQDTPPPALPPSITPSSQTSTAIPSGPRGLNVNRLNFR